MSFGIQCKDPLGVTQLDTSKSATRWLATIDVGDPATSSYYNAQFSSVNKLFWQFNPKQLGTDSYTGFPIIARINVPEPSGGTVTWTVTFPDGYSPQYAGKLVIMVFG